MLGVAAALLCTALLPARAEPTGAITIAIGSDVSTLDPTMDISIIGLKVSGNIFSALTLINSDGAVGPDLATSWSANDQATVWTFKLDARAKFQDGTPVTIDDVMWTINKERDDATSPVHSYVTLIKSIDRVDDSTIRFNLTAPFSAFDRQVSLLNIASQAAYQREGADEFSKHPVGSGPYRVVQWVKDDHVEMQADPNHWKGAAKIKTLIFRPIASEAARFAALQSGDVDLAVGLPPAIIDRIKDRPGLKVETVPSNQIVYVGINLTNPALSDLRMRQAIDLSLDRTAITAKLLRGMGKPIGGMVAPMTFGYDASVRTTDRNVEKARQLVKDSGYKGEVIAFQYPNNSITLGNEVAQAIAGYLKEAGINVELQGMEYPAFSAIWLQRKLTGLYLHSFGPSIMDADLPLTLLYQSKTTRGYWTDAQVDDLIIRQRGQAKPADRQQAIAQVWKLGKDAIPYAPVYNVQDSYGMASKLKWSPRPDGRLFFVDAELATAN